MPKTLEPEPTPLGADALRQVLGGTQHVGREGSAPAPTLPPPRPPLPTVPIPVAPMPAGPAPKPAPPWPGATP
jgi:hypothetical protein